MEGRGGDEGPALPALSREEDDELRRLHWLAQNGELSPLFRDRYEERRRRDRRQEIRPPRELDDPTFSQTATL